MNKLGTTSTESATDSNHVIRVVQTLELLAGKPMNAQALADKLGIHRRTATRLLDNLVLCGWVQPKRDKKNSFSLSLRVLSVMGNVLATVDVVEVAKPHVRSLRDQINESSHLVISTGVAAVHVYEAVSAHQLAVTAFIGEKAVLHASAVGKVLIAYDPGLAEVAFRGELRQLTSATLTTVAELTAEIDRTRQQGFAFDDREVTPETRCIAAPVHNGLGEVVGALGISGPTARVTDDKIEVFAELVVKEADLMSRSLGFSGDERVNVKQA